MKRVRILVPFDGYAVGDTPEFHGHIARGYVADGRAEDINDEAPTETAAPVKKAKGRK